MPVEKTIHSHFFVREEAPGNMVENNLVVLNSTVLQGSTSIFGTLNATSATSSFGATTATSLSVSGPTTLNNVTVTGTIGATGSTTLGDTVIDGTLQVNEPTVIDELEVTNALTTGGQLVGLARDIPTAGHLEFAPTPIDLKAVTTLTLVGTYPFTVPVAGGATYRILAGVTFNWLQNGPDIGTFELRVIPDGGVEATFSRLVREPSGTGAKEQSGEMGGGVLATFSGAATGEIRVYLNRSQLRSQDRMFFHHIAFRL